MISLHGVERHFNVGDVSVAALRGADLEVAEGEMAAGMGPSGSGKTTLLGIIGGLDRPGAGSVSVGGVDVTKLAGEELALYRLRWVGFVFQAPGLIPLMSALENVALPLQLMGRDQAAARDIALDALELVALEKEPHPRGDGRRGGEQQRVALARAIAKQPRVLLADEPTRPPDPGTPAPL